MADDKLTTGPGPNSTILGRAQAIYGSACLEEIGLIMTMNLVFTGLDYNGSTLSLLGRNAVFHTYREMSIVGGSGLFRMARGVATAKTYTFNLTSGDAVVEFNVMVEHY
ncbi:putative dirigent protein [Helianthus debilis subsp. tardiflorus]